MNTSTAAGVRADRLPRLMSVREVSEYLSIPVATLYRWRHMGSGPKATRVGATCARALPTWPTGCAAARRHGHGRAPRRVDRSGATAVTYRVRWRDPLKRKPAKSFNRRADAERSSEHAGAHLVRGEYVDPSAARCPSRAYASRWLRRDLPQRHGRHRGPSVALMRPSLGSPTADGR